ncbi:MAG: sulfatase [Planctomycetes bacterium]|jgi:arylsulfatase A-like enzyme|nr:sulfatase [Planctomycetota bacterium]
MPLRRTLARLAVVAVVAAAACSGPPPAPQRPARPPNVVVFLVDDMGTQETSVPFQTVASELNRVYRTPAMERLAREGTRFTQAYASAVCSPSRISLLTGMNVARHGVTNWTLRQDRSPDQPHPTLQPPDWPRNGLTTPDRPIAGTVAATPLPALLRAAGYRTIHVGKAHFGAIGTPGADPCTLGFDVNVAGHAAGGPGSYHGEHNYSAAWRNGDRIWDVPGLERYHGTDVNLTEALTREAIAELERAHRDRTPFFLHLSHYAIHAPWEDDARFRAAYDRAGLAPRQATLASMIEGMDRSLADVLAALDRLGLTDDTVVLFLSDNGSPAQCPPNLPLRGHKLSPYEGGVRVPMLARWPGVTRAGTTSEACVVVDDLFPTILECAGIDWRDRVAQTVDGVSFVPTLRDPGTGAADRALVWHYPHQYSGQAPWSAIRRGDHKLVHHHADGRLELFDVVTDPGEHHDLAAHQPTLVQQLAGELGRLLRERGARMPTRQADGSPVPFADAVATPR